MKSKQESRAPAKQATPAKKSAAGPKTVAVAAGGSKKGLASPSQADVDDVAELFSAIKQTKTLQKGTGATSAQTPSGGAAGRSQGKDKTAGSSGRSAPSASSSSAAKPVRDGLYHAPQKSVQMSDNDFFSGTWLKADAATAAAASSSGSGVVVAGSSGGEPAEASQEMLRKEGVDRIVTMEELSKMLSRNARAGTTPNCPFDCDCCF